MARCIAFCLFLHTLLGAACAAPSRPGSQYELRIGDQTHLVVEGAPTRVWINGTPTTVQIARAQSNKLTIDGFSFSYPESFRKLASANDSDPDSASWMLKGRSSQITVHRKPKQTTLNFLVKHMGDFYEGLDAAKDVKRKPTRMRFGQTEATGVRFQMNSKGEGVNFHDYFQLPVSSPRYNYFLIVHSRPGNREATEAKAMIGRTLE